MIRRAPPAKEVRRLVWRSHLGTTPHAVVSPPYRARTGVCKRLAHVTRHNAHGLKGGAVLFFTNGAFSPISGLLTIDWRRTGDER